MSPTHQDAVTSAYAIINILLTAMSHPDSEPQKDFVVEALNTVREKLEGPAQSAH